jgi:hypothetical protein
MAAALGGELGYWEVSRGKKRKSENERERERGRKRRAVREKGGRGRCPGAGSRGVLVGLEAASRRWHRRSPGSLHAPGSRRRQPTIANSPFDFGVFSGKKQNNTLFCIILCFKFV